MFDLKDAGPQRRRLERYGLEALTAALRRTAESWVRQLFPNGRKVEGVWRLASIKGDPPRKHGSCVLQPSGPRAGDWFDFDGNQGGGPLSAIAAATRLEGRNLFARAAE